MGTDPTTIDKPGSRKVDMFIVQVPSPISLNEPEKTYDLLVERIVEGFRGEEILVLDRGDGEVYYSISNVSNPDNGRTLACEVWKQWRKSDAGERVTERELRELYGSIPNPGDWRILK